MLLTLDLLAIAGVCGVMLLALLAARERAAARRAGRPPKTGRAGAAPSVAPRFQHWEPEDFEPVAGRSATANVSTPVTLWEEVVAGPLRPVGAKEQPAVVEASATMQMVERNYTDPIDGMLFEPGEPVIACRCGLGYRAESVRWLHQQCAGRCAQCNAELPAIDQDQ
jgi:hypothetical protein